MNISVDKSLLKHLDRTIIWHAFSQMSEYEGFLIESAKGCWLTDIDGRNILDGASSLWCNIHGHRHPKIDEAICAQLSMVAHVTNLGMSHPVTIALAQKLLDYVPDGLKHVFFSGDGASAIEAAIKIAFQYWRQCENPQPQRTKFLCLGNAYHGDTLGAVSVGGVSRFHSLFEPLMFEVIRGPCPDSYRLPLQVTPETAVDHYLSEYRLLLEKYQHEIAAVIVEPLVQAAAGMVVHPHGFLEGLSNLCQQYDCLLIADEVAVGMGRTGRMFACEHEGVVPDLLCIGKGLTGGYLPMSATIVTDRIWNAFLGSAVQGRAFLHGHTYGGNPLCSAAALATLEIFESEKTLDLLESKVQQLAEKLAVISEHPNIGDVRQIGLLAAIEVVEDKELKRPFDFAKRITTRICSRILEKNVWLRPLGNTIPIVPPLAISSEEIDLLVEAIHYGVASSLLHA